MDQLDTYLTSIVDFAKTFIPEADIPMSILSLTATAGMRLLTPEDQTLVMTATCNYFK